MSVRVEQPPLTDEQRSLVAKYYPLAYHVATRQARRPGNRRDYHSVCESVHAGVMGLIRAAQLFDPGRGVDFKTYAYRSIEHAISREWYAHAHLIRVPKKPRLERGIDSDRADITRRLTPAPLTLKNEKAIDYPVLFEEQEEEALRAGSLRQAIGRLKPIERMIIRERFFKGRTLLSIGDEIGRTRERVRQIEKEALEKLRDLLGEVV